MKVGDRLLLPPAHLQIHHVSIRRVIGVPITTSQDDVSRHVTNREIAQVLVVGERGQGSLDHVFRVCEVGNLVRRHRLTLLEGIYVLFHDQSLGREEVEAVILEFLCFSRHLVQYHDALSELGAVIRGECNYLRYMPGILAASDSSAVAVPVDQL